MKENESQSQNLIMEAINWAYDKAVDGAPGLESAKELAEDYLKGEGTLQEKANSLIRWQIAKAGTSGFLTGLGGLLTMPVTIPANLASVMYIQVRMIAAIAHLGGHDLKNDRVKSFVYACLMGNAMKDVLKDIGIVLGTKLTQEAIKKITGKALTEINQKVGFRLLTKFGEKGLINLGKLAPVVGGIVAGTIDSASTNMIGNVARDIFIGKES